MAGGHSTRLPHLGRHTVVSLTSRKLTKRALNCSAKGLSKAGRCLSQHSTKGMSPRMLGSRYTIPQRDTVAGEATARSCTSNIMVIAWCQDELREWASRQPPRQGKGLRGHGEVLPILQLWAGHGAGAGPGTGLGWGQMQEPFGPQLITQPSPEAKKESKEIPGSPLASLGSGHFGVPRALGISDGSCVLCSKAPHLCTWTQGHTDIQVFSEGLKRLAALRLRQYPSFSKNCPTLPTRQLFPSSPDSRHIASMPNPEWADMTANRPGRHSINQELG